MCEGEGEVRSGRGSEKGVRCVRRRGRVGVPSRQRKETIAMVLKVVSTAGPNLRAKRSGSVRSCILLSLSKARPERVSSNLPGVLC